MLPLVIVIGPSESFALMSAVTAGGTTETLITTESAAVLVPLVQLRVSMVELPTTGYHWWLGVIGPPTPAREIPDTPVGDVRVQAVAPVEDQLYE